MSKNGEKMRNGLILLTILALGCATPQLAPQAEAVRVTENPMDVASCKMLGLVEARQVMGNLNLTDVRNNQLRNATAVLGGDTVLYTGAVNNRWDGVAYQCKGSSPAAR